MKQLAILLFSLFTISGISAQQLSRNTLMVGGSLNFGTSRTDPDPAMSFPGDRSTSLGFYPAVGKFYRENRAAGISLSFYKNWFDQHSSRDVSSYGGGVFLRQYLPLGKQFFVFANERLSISRSKDFDEVQGFSYKDHRRTSIDLGANPGLAFSVWQNIHLELTLPELVNIGYGRFNEKNWTNGSPETLRKGSSFSLNTGLSGGVLSYLGVGFRWFIPNAFK